LNQYSFIISPEAYDDLHRLQDFWIKMAGADLAERALNTIIKAFDLLQTFPHSCRKAYSEELQIPCRELIIPFGNSGYLALFTIHEETQEVSILAVRHQRESDYH
jgi:plasmid stabilization system protein ParE